MALSENYFKSRDVRVFPSSFRGTYNNTTTFDPEARLNTEANFIAPKISGNKASYIVNYNTNKIKFVLGGYYFEINNITAYNLNDKYLNIKLREFTIAENQNDANKDSERKTSLLETWEENNDHILDSVDSEDNISYFSGLKISSISPENVAYASIKLFDAEGNINQEAILVDLDHGKGANTLMHGVGLTADTINQTVFGTYNNNKVDTLFEVGKGSSENNKNNALEISPTTTTINNATNINGNTIITGNTKIDGTAEITNNTEIKGDLTISKDTESTSSTTGALKVTGGVGINKNLNVGGDTNLNSKLIVKTSPADTETNVKVDGTLNVTGKTDIYSNVTVDSNKTTLAKPVEVTDASDNALTVKGKTTIEKDLEVGNSTKILTVKNSPDTGEQNVTITGTLKSTGKATFENGLEVASGKTTTLGGQVNITGAVNINTSNQTNPGDTTIYGNTTINGDTSIIGNTSITGTVNITGKATSASTASTDGNTTLTTKDYVDNRITALDVASVGEDGKYLKTISELDGKITATAQSFDTAISDSSTDTNAPTSKAVKDFVEMEISSISAPKVGGTKTVIINGKEVNEFSYISSIKQSAGKITAIADSFSTEISAASSNSTAPTAKAVWDALDTKSKEILTQSLRPLQNTDCFVYWMQDTLDSPGIKPSDKNKGWTSYNIDTILGGTGHKYEILAVFATPVVSQATGIIDRINGKEDGAEAEQMGRWANAYYVDLSNDKKTFYILNVNPWDALIINILLILKEID